MSGAPKVDVSKLLADLADKKAKLLEQKKLAAEHAATTASALAATAPPPPTAASSLTAQQQAALAAARAAAAALNVPKASAAASTTSGPKALRLDSQGREIDEHGQLVVQQRAAAHASSLANQKLHEQLSDAAKRDSSEARARAMLKLGADASSSAAADRGRSLRQARGLAFVEPGAFVDKAEKARDELYARQLKKKENAELWASRATLVDPIVDLDALVSRDAVQRVPLGRAAAAAAAAVESSGGVPLVEWWDKPVLADPSSYDANFDDAAAAGSGMQVDGPAVRLNDKSVTVFVEHPVPTKPLVVTKPPPPPKLMLTKAEAKRIRKQNRAEKEEARRERVLYGLEEEKKPKVKLSNMMRVHGAAAVMDPTALEAMVQREVAERLAKHEHDNAERALTPAQRREKKRRKLIDDTAAGTHVAVYRVRDLSHPQRRYKVNWTAKELLLTGAVVSLPAFSIVVVEGGAKALAKFKKLMLRRIDWTASTPITSQYFKNQLAAQLAGADPDSVASTSTAAATTAATTATAADDNDAEAESVDHDFELDDEARERLNAALQPDCSANECMLVWEGVVATRAFRTWSLESAATERAARFFLRQHNVEHYFNVVADANESFGVKSIEQ